MAKHNTDPIVVIGMHRSGTGLLAEMLANLGVSMGRRIEQNDESTFFLRVNEWILYQAGGAWFAPGPMRAALKDQEFVELVGRHVARIARSPFAAEHFGAKRGAGERIWGFKDPRSTVTLPVWEQVYPQMRVVSIRRNGVDVAQSLVARARQIREGSSRLNYPEMSLGHRFPRANIRNQLAASNLQSALELWRDYCEAEDEILSRRPDSLLLRYEDVLADPAAAVDQLIAGFGLAASEQQIRRARAVVRPTRPATSSSIALTVDQRALLARFGYPEWS